MAVREEFGGVELARKVFRDRTVRSVSTTGGWLEIIFTDGTELLVSGDYGQSLAVDVLYREEE